MKQLFLVTFLVLVFATSAGTKEDLLKEEQQKIRVITTMTAELLNTDKRLEKLDLEVKRRRLAMVKILEKHPDIVALESTKEKDPISYHKAYQLKYLELIKSNDELKTLYVDVQRLQDDLERKLLANSTIGPHITRLAEIRAALKTMK